MLLMAMTLGVIAIGIWVVVERRIVERREEQDKLKRDNNKG